jgi:hypothetical protein
MEHSHSFCGETSYDDGHIHHYGGITSKSASGVPHIHSMKETTSFIDDHRHDYMTKTGPAILIQGGLHYHYYETTVEYEDGHIHFISGYTSAD